MFYEQTEFHNYLSKNGFSEIIYDSMKKDDVAEVVVTALNVMLQSGAMPKSLIDGKSGQKSADNRIIGNRLFQAGEFYEALQYYNIALLHAPYKSQEMMFAYSNRSVLYKRLKAYDACLKDIELCNSLGFSNEKLESRKKECLKNLPHKDKHNFLNSAFAKDFFKFDVKRNPEIPCVSKDVGVVIENNSPKIFATKDIKLGTVVAIEKAFVTHIIDENKYFACYHCNRKSLNLIPCDGCNVTLYCDEICKETAKNEYHKFECQIILSLEALCPTTTSRLASKAMLKMKQMCKSWKMFIEASYNIGFNKMKNSSINEIFDGNNKFSLLNFNDSNTKIVHGSVFNMAFACAVIIHHLDKISFFPVLSDEKNEAMRAVARCFVNLAVYFPNRVTIDEVVENKSSSKLVIGINHNCGWFAFTNRLKHSCDANLLPVGLNNKIALVALQPIKKGTELTISYIGHRYQSDVNQETRAVQLYSTTRLVCNCEMCDGSWETKSFKVGFSAKEHHIMCYLKWSMATKNSVTPAYDETVYKTTVDALAVFNDMRNTIEHHEMFAQFRKFLNVYQFVATKNYVLEHTDLSIFF